MTAGQIIQTIRKERGYTQKQLAEKCGLATGTIQQYELNKREPRREQLQKIADALNVPLYELMGFDGSIRVKMTPKLIEINQIENKLKNDRENVTDKEYKILYDYYNSDQFKENWKRVSQNMKEVLDIYNNMIGNVTSSSDIVYVDSDALEYNRIIDKQKNRDGFTPYEKRFISDYIDKSPLVSEWFIENGLKSKEKNLERIQSAYEHLNNEGREEAAKRIEELTEIERYTKPDEWFKGKPTKEEIDKALKSYLDDEVKDDPPQE